MPTLPAPVELGSGKSFCGLPTFFMAVSQSYRTYVLEQLGRVNPVTSKSMFGGVGIYSGGFFFGLISQDRLYFEVDDDTRPEFERPFRPFAEDHAMGYYKVPADVIDPTQLVSWMHKAILVAKKAKQVKRKQAG